jgi:AhpD family alkylhydroperoxidase
MEPRIAPGTRAQLGFVNSLIVGAIGRATGGRPPNVFTTLGRNRGLFRRWLWFAGGLMPGGKLPRADTELVILRVAHLTDCQYEWDHHERIGRSAGLSPEEIERVHSGAAAAGWDERRRLLLGAVEEMLTEGELGDDLWAALAAELKEAELIELCLLIGHYEMLAKTLKTLRVQRDPQRSRL